MKDVFDSSAPGTLSDLPDTLPTLETHLGYWLRRVSNHVSGAFARQLQQRQTSVAEWVALRHIYGSSNITSAELANRIGMTRGAISKVLDKLEAKRWIARAANPEDNRVQWLTLTSGGEQVLPKLAQIADSNDVAFFACLSTEEQVLLRTLLQKLTNAHQWNDTPID